jgi:hypothetical protein
MDFGPVNASRAQNLQHSGDDVMKLRPNCFISRISTKESPGFDQAHVKPMAVATL